MFHRIRPGTGRIRFVHKNLTGGVPNF
jgi:hypothetical protein